MGTKNKNKMQYVCYGYVFYDITENASIFQHLYQELHKIFFCNTAYPYGEGIFTSLSLEIWKLPYMFYTWSDRFYIVHAFQL